MTTSQRYLESKMTAGFPDMEWQTPAVSEKFQSRFGHRPGTADSGDTGLGATPSDSTEDFCSSSSSPSFQPIRSQIPIPTAHVMPSTAGPPASNPRPCSQEDSQASAEAHRPSSGSRTSGGTSNSKSSSLSKSASSPNLDMAQGGAGRADPTGPKPDCLNRYRSLVNGLDHSLFPSGDHSCMDEGQRFDMPAMEPTMNQSALLAGYCPDVRLRLQMTSLGETPKGNREAYRGAMEHSYKALPEIRPGVPGAPDPYSQRSSQPGGTGAGSAGVYPSSLYLQTQALLREAKAYEPMLQERCSELPSWQQQHKQQLESLRMQVEQMQMMTAGVGQYPALYSTPSMPPEARKWDEVIKANESILKELAIERQKQQMSQLESELQVHGGLLGRGALYGDVCLLRLQEAQRENAFLRAQFAERGDCAAQEEAERRLGAVEAETRRLNDALRETSERHAEEMKKQEERIRSRDKHINSLKKKCQKEAEQNREKQQRIETLERYLADLPTMEDYQGQRKQLSEVEQRAFQLQGQVRELEVCLEEARSHIREKDTQLEEQRRRERELLTTVTSLQERVQEGLEDGARLPSLDVEKLRGENSSLREEQQTLKKVIEKQLRMMTKLGTQIVTLEEQVSQEESSSHALREEVCSKEQGLLQLHTAMKELSAQNQELTEQNLTLHERLEDSEKVNLGRTSSSLRPAGARLTQRLHGEMASCLCDLRSLCNVLTQRSQGRDPNLSLLLGVSSPPPMAEQVEDWLSPEVLQRKLTEAQQLRRDVEELRTTISDRYAQDMGENCITQ
ncbi:centrosomal protein of 85 kDa isoform X1 [Salmo trutta]|uniref:Centrosomal protein 85 n=1 Tax=Salmo trutta TaxID=8032 RepID=A0A673WB11_SALTR|nr:centrosomal protein of 85 kDa-like isoform X1 [Salmo trutta]XP_029592056.1 centrosomal protein of 85 kDa-like isoform X1 [Salmo trutta]